MARFASVAKFAKNVAQKTLEVFCLRAPLSPSFTAVDRKLEKLTMRYKAPAFDMNELQLMYHALTVKGDVYRFRGDIIDEGLSQLVSSFESEPLFEERSWPRWMQLELLIRSEEVAVSFEMKIFPPTDY